MPRVCDHRLILPFVTYYLLPVTCLFVTLFKFAHSIDTAGNRTAAAKSNMHYPDII